MPQFSRLGYFVCMYAIMYLCLHVLVQLFFLYILTGMLFTMLCANLSQYSFMICTVESGVYSLHAMLNVVHRL